MNSKNIDTNSPLPKIMIVGEAPISEDAGGASQTIYNLFKKYPPEYLFSVSTKEAQHDYTTKSYVKNITFTRMSFIPIIHNRIGLLVNKFIQNINFFIRKHKGIDEPQKIRAFNPDLIILCPNNVFHLLYGLKMVAELKKPFITYYMDNWMQAGLKQKSYIDTYTLTKKSLEDAKAWLMISPELNHILSDEYQIKNKPFHVVQNTVDISTTSIQNNNNSSNKPFRIIYAGSIWPMHYDSLKLFSETVYQMRKEGIAIELVIYTFKHFWDAYNNELTPLEVHYGGSLKYNEVRNKLLEGDLLLVSSSFSEAWKSHSMGSVQTKITDYMGAGKTIFSYGPDYSACHRFVNEWKVGFTSSQMPNELKQTLINLINNPSELSSIGENNIKVLQNNFSSDVVCPRLYEFITKFIPIKGN